MVNIFKGEEWYIYTTHALLYIYFPCWLGSLPDKVKVWKQGDRKASRLTVVVHKKPGETLVEVDEPFRADL